MRNRDGRLREKINYVKKRLNYVKKRLREKIDCVEKRLREKRERLRERKNYEKKRLNYVEKRLREKLNYVKKRQNNVDGKLIEKRDSGKSWLKMRDDRRKCNNRLSYLQRQRELDRQTARDRAEEARRDSAVLRGKLFGDAMRASAVRMGVDPIEAIPFFRNVEQLFDVYDVPAELRPVLVRPFLNDKAKGNWVLKFWEIMSA